MAQEPAFNEEENVAMQTKQFKRQLTVLSASVLTLLSVGLPSAVQASSHREALAVLSDPCVDNADVYAWVKPGTH